jgi:hypothetical protein
MTNKKKDKNHCTHYSSPYKIKKKLSNFNHIIFQWQKKNTNNYIIAIHNTIISQPIIKKNKETIVLISYYINYNE